MNQILATENKKNKRNSSGPIEIKSIIRFFAVIIIIFGIVLIGEGCYAMYEESTFQNPKNAPKVTISRQNDEAIVSIEHNIEISKIVYRWNNGEDTVIPVNSTVAVENIKLLGYDSTLYLMVEDVTGKQSNYTKQYILENVDITKPTIEVKTENGNSNMTIIATDDTAVKSITYQWEDEEPVVIYAETENQTTFERQIELTPGTKKIKITVEDTNGNIAEVEKEIIATTSKPEMSVQLLEGGKFYILASDKDGIASIEINLNGQVLSTSNINLKQIQTGELQLKEGNNTLSISITNVNGYTEIRATEIPYNI